MAASTARVAITLDVHWFDYLLRAASLPKGAVVAVFDRNGAILATNDRDVAPAIAAAALKAGVPDGVSLRRAISGGHAWHFGNAALTGQHICSSPSASARAGCSARPICMSASISCCPSS